MYSPRGFVPIVAISDRSLSFVSFDLKCVARYLPTVPDLFQIFFFGIEQMKFPESVFSFFHRAEPYRRGCYGYIEMRDIIIRRR